MKLTCHTDMHAYYVTLACSVQHVNDLLDRDRHAFTYVCINGSFANTRVHFVRMLVVVGGGGGGGAGGMAAF